MNQKDHTILYFQIVITDDLETLCNRLNCLTGIEMDLLLSVFSVYTYGEIENITVKFGPLLCCKWRGRTVNRFSKTHLGLFVTGNGINCIMQRSVINAVFAEI